MSDFTFDLFLSHNSKDKAEVQLLAKAASGLKCWLDKEQLPPGQNWQPLIESGLKNSRAIAACFGRAGIGPWQDEEMQAAMNLAVRQKRPVIPVLLPGAAHEPELPLFLENRGWVDFRQGYSEEALARLRWGVTGISPAGDGSSTVAPVFDPAEYERRVREVFGTQYEMLKGILDQNTGLQQFLARHYKIEDTSSSVTSAKLITAFHADFLEAISVFSSGCRKGKITHSAAADLLGSVIYLSMCPEYASRLLEKGNSHVLEINPKARQGIAEMLVAWVDARGQGRVPLGNLSTEKPPGVFETTPQMMAVTIKHDLMDRVQVDKNAIDAATQLDIELDWRRRNEQREFITVAVQNEADKAIVRELETSPELRHAVLLVVSSDHTIHPGKKATDADYDQRFETFLQKLVKQVIPTSDTTAKP